MNLLPIYAERIAALPPAPERRNLLGRIPKAKSYYRNVLRYVQTEQDAKDVAQLASELDLSWVGFDTEYKYDSSPVPVKKGKMWYDPRSIHPLLLSIALVEK